MSTALKNLTREQCNDLYIQVLKDDDVETMRDLCKNDLFFLLTVACKRKDINRAWLYDRCREVEENPDDMLFLWAREHYKSTLITFGMTITEILNNPEATCAVFSHTRPIAKAFVAQIKSELEQNEFLKDLFPEILYKNPQAESPCWSLENGIVVKRATNPKEPTLAGWGLIDGQPISKHYSLVIYDDVVTPASVSTPEQISKCNNMWGLSLSLGAAGGKTRYIGTRYHANDTWQFIMDQKAATPNIKAATEDGKIDGKSVFMTEEVLAKRKQSGSAVFAAQYLQDPLADSAQGFNVDDMRFYDEHAFNYSSMNLYITVDAAGERKMKNTGADYTAMDVIGLGADNNYYLIDAVRDRLNLTERAKILFAWHMKYKPRAVGYERYGAMSDIAHMQDKMQRDNYRFEITELGGQMPKNDRIRQLIPVFEYHRFHFPHKLHFMAHDGKMVDWVNKFVKEEFSTFPLCSHDDALDALARIVDPALGATFPRTQTQVQRKANTGQRRSPMARMR